MTAKLGIRDPVLPGAAYVQNLGIRVPVASAAAGGGGGGGGGGTPDGGYIYRAAPVGEFREHPAFRFRQYPTG